MKARRPAARILLVDGAGRVLLFRFTPADRPPFWCTVGGAVDRGETYEQAAQRELFEETGLTLPVGEQVARREIEFLTLDGIPVSADERYFRVDADTADISTVGHTELERRVMQQWRWFARDEIAAHPEMIYPEDLIDLLEATDP